MRHHKSHPNRHLDVALTTANRRRQLALSVVAVFALGAAACGSDKADAPATTVAAATTAAPTTAAAAATTEAPATSEAPASTESATTESATTESASTESASTDSATTDSATTDSTTGSTTGSSGSTAPFDAAAYCKAETALEEATGALGDPSEDPKAYATAFLAVIQPARDLAPADLVSFFDTAITGLKSVESTGDLSALPQGEPTEVHTYDVANCGWTSTAVSLQNYKFVNLPDKLTAGTYNFEVTNEGTEPHLLIIVKKKEGVTTSWDDLLADPDGQNQVDTFVQVFTPPGGNDHGVGTLAPGEYLALCPISQGSTAETEGTGMPHFMLGMKQIITVTG